MAQTIQEIRAEKALLQKALSDLDVAERSALGEKIKLRSDFDRMTPQEKSDFFKTGGTIVD